MKALTIQFQPGQYVAEIVRADGWDGDDALAPGTYACIGLVGEWDPLFTWQAALLAGGTIQYAVLGAPNLLRTDYTASLRERQSDDVIVSGPGFSLDYLLPRAQS